MFEPFAPAIDAFAKLLARNYRELFGKTEPDHVPVLRATAKLALERIAATDALYHDELHTLFVTDVGQAILRGRAMVEPVSREGWLHFTVATLLHDIGYLRGICPGDGDGRYVIDAAGNTVAAPRGATDAFLAPWHVERGQLFVRHRCAAVPGLDVERLCRAIELTRFPVPDDRDHAEAETEAGLVRAADLIGQLADPAYPRKLAALYCEFRETGVAEQLGYRDPADLAEQYPRFFWGRWSRTSGRRCATWSGRRTGGCGWRSSTRTCSWRSTCGAGSGRSGAWAPAASCGWSRAGRRRRARSRAGGRPGPSTSAARTSASAEGALLGRRRHGRRGSSWWAGRRISRVVAARLRRSCPRGTARSRRHRGGNRTWTHSSAPKSASVDGPPGSSRL